MQQSFSVWTTGWYDIDLSTPLQIDASHDLWVFIYDPDYRNHPATYCDYDGSEGNYYSTSPTSWIGTADNAAFLIRTFVTDGAYTYDIYRNDECIASNVSGTSYNDDDLPDGVYSYSLKTHYYGGLTEASNEVTLTIGNSSIQTIPLASGTNWFSPNVEITLNDLKAALVEALPDSTSITIKSKDGGSTIYNGSNWRGRLDSLDMIQMYMVTIPTSCEITLVGAPIVPAELPITIKNGVNWIAYPLTESRTLTDAFVEFVLSGDQVKSKDNGSSIYSDLWRGTLTTLEPGLGYIFKSTDQSNRILIFPTSAK